MIATVVVLACAAVTQLLFLWRNHHRATQEELAKVRAELRAALASRDELQAELAAMTEKMTFWKDLSFRLTDAVKALATYHRETVVWLKDEVRAAKAMRTAGGFW